MEIKKILESLGINPQNSGAAIGGNWLHTNSEIISSFSPCFNPTYWTQRLICLFYIILMKPYYKN